MFITLIINNCALKRKHYASFDKVFIFTIDKMTAIVMKNGMKYIIVIFQKCIFKALTILILYNRIVQLHNIMLYLQNGNTFMPLPQSDPMEFFSHRTNSSSESKFPEDSRLHSNPGTTSSHNSSNQRIIPNWSDILPPPPPDQPPPPSPNSNKNFYNLRRQPPIQQVRKVFS